MTTHYTIFGLPPECPYEALHARYRELAAQWHPDRNHDKDAPHNMRILTEAWNIFKNSRSRQSYNDELRMRGLICDHCHGTGNHVAYKGWRRAESVPCAVCNGKGIRN